ncbi:MAG: S41 family peptidase [Chloroflexota bacterium]
MYTGRILMLIGIEIGSAGEDFVIPFKSSGRATLIGENTLGSTGQPYHYRLIDDIWV